jgi:flagellar operon protein
VSEQVFQPGPILGPGPIAPPQRPAARPAAPVNGPAFADVLADKVNAGGGVRFSNHALDRLRRRGIDLDEAALARLNDGVARAAGKGSRDSLVLLDDTAFVVSVRNRTVVTAVGREHMKEQVFTNIDSAVIA